MAGIMRICAGLVGPKSENVDFSLVFQAFLKGPKERRVRQPYEQPSEPERLGGGRGRVNPPPGACLEVWEDWRV